MAKGTQSSSVLFSFCGASLLASPWHNHFLANSLWMIIPTGVLLLSSHEGTHLRAFSMGGGMAPCSRFLHGLTILLQSITARVDPGEEPVNIYLYDDWYHVDINVGDYSTRTYFILDGLLTFCKVIASMPLGHFLRPRCRSRIINPDLFQSLHNRTSLFSTPTSSSPPRPYLVLLNVDANPCSLRSCIRRAIPPHL